MPRCDNCSGSGQLNPYGQVTTPCGHCSGTGSTGSSGTSGGGRLKSLAGWLLVAYVVFYFAFTPGAIKDPASVLTVTYERVQDWLASIVERLG